MTVCAISPKLNYQPMSQKLNYQPISRKRRYLLSQNNKAQWFIMIDEMMKQAELVQEVHYLVQTIRDPEFNQHTLADLKIITPGSIKLTSITTKWGQTIPIIQITMRPTTPHCHLALQIGLAIHLRLKRELAGYSHYKIRVQCQPGSHLKEEDIGKQINDKERIAAAFQNRQIMDFLLPLVE